MNKERLEEIKYFISANLYSPKLSPYLQVIVIEFTDFFDSEDFNYLSSRMSIQYYLLNQVMCLSVGFLRYKHADKNRVGAALTTIIDAILFSYEEALEFEDEEEELVLEDENGKEEENEK